MKLFDLAGEVAIVTGSSRGIGRAIAERLAEHGARVVVSSRTADACVAVATAINNVHGVGKATALAANISSKEDLRSLVDRTHHALGRVSILICNAASNPYYGPMDGITDEQFRKILDNNILSNHWLMQMVAPQMIEARRGAMVIISSNAALRATPMIGAYTVAKAADMQLARTLALEWGKHNIRVNCIAPGLVQTDFARRLWEDPQALAKATGGWPLARIGSPDEIAGVAVFLASEAARYVTGQTIVADGGSSIV